MNNIIHLFESLHTLFWLNPFAQIIGFVALMVGASAFFHKDDQKLRYYLTAFTLLMAVHFFLLGLWSATLMALLSSARNYVSSLTSNLWVMLFFLTTAWLLAIVNTDGWIHLLPALGVSMGTWAVFREKGLRMRLFMLMGTICWLSHNMLVGSIGGVIIEIIFLIVNSRTILKLFNDKATQ